MRYIGLVLIDSHSVPHLYRQDATYINLDPLGLLSVGHNKQN